MQLAFLLGRGGLGVGLFFGILLDVHLKNIQIMIWHRQYIVGCVVAV